MRKTAHIYLLLLFFTTIFFAGCDKDTPKNSELLIGSWTKFYVSSDTSFNVKMTFNDNGTFTWEMLEVVSTHLNSYLDYFATETDIELINDPECGVDIEGKYSYNITEDKLKISLVSDECSQRISGFSGEWKRFE